jgi:putative oxidoreductase
MSFLDSYGPQSKSLLRIVAGLLFFSVGLAKIFHFPAGTMFDHAQLMEWPEGPAGVIELIGGSLIVLGFFSRYAAFICSGEMAIAYFLAHWAVVTGSPHSFFPVLNGGAPAILYCFVFLYFAATGPGPWAINQK